MPPRSKVSNLFPMEAPMNRPHSARFGTGRQFTKKAPRPNVNASYRNTHTNFVAQNDESFTRGVVAANQAMLKRMSPNSRKLELIKRQLQTHHSPFGIWNPYGCRSKRRSTRRTRKGTRKYRH